ncbi:MAG: hypothetical protein HRT47_03255 [Candidatus Caenarcaniphilales bacterium]|nr:hypothetical protein [Candidatus Caenarcaniphilales bacterium]
MPFTLIAYDHTDMNAYARRLEVREEHLEMAETMRIDGKLLYAVALMDQFQEKIIGSVMVFNLESKEEIDQYLAEEVYVKNNVWDQIQVFPGKVAPGF